jgi:protein tyrosine phosphatase (PTP) superfamily phosphohydrolase (DUF442 family)
MAVAGLLGACGILAAPPGGAALKADSPRHQADLPGLENVFRLSAKIYSGSEPDGEVGFASLARLGVRTIVSVDGARPDVQAARRNGLRYVHIPIGYDGISAEAGKALARAARQCQGPIYVHCHHGKHRGPAAAAIACKATDGRSAEALLKILELAGTDKQYAGLWRDVARYEPPGHDELLPDLVEAAEVNSLAAAMSQLDRHVDHLKQCRDAAWSVPPAHPDLVPHQEAVIVKEGLREARRNLSGSYDSIFKTWLVEAAESAERLEVLLRSGESAAATRQFQLLEQSCNRCHAKYRNGNKSTSSP